MTGARVLLLRATRLVRRAPVRSLATGFLVMVAVLAGSLWLSESRGYFEQHSSVDSQLGQADVRYDLFDDDWLPTTSAEAGMSSPISYEDDQLPRLPVVEQVDAVLAALPEGSDVAVLETFGRIDVGTVAISDPVTVHQGPWTDPLLAGMVDLADGRLPGPGEVVVPPSLARSLGVDIGDRLVVRNPVAVLDVVGLGSNAPWPHLVVAAGEFVATDAAAEGLLSPYGSASVLATLPTGDPAPTVPVGTEPSAGPVVEPSGRGFFSAQPPVGTSTGIVVAITALVGLSAGAAFGIGATRRRRALGLLAANGATQGQLRLAAGAEALVVSVPAVILGVLVALLAPGVWVRLRLPGWDWMWSVEIPLDWVGLLAVAAVVTAVSGRRCSAAPPVPRPSPRCWTTAVRPLGPDPHDRDGRGG